MSLQCSDVTRWDGAENEYLSASRAFRVGSGQVRYRLADRYLEFVPGRCRPNTLRAVAFNLKAFFTGILYV